MNLVFTIITAETKQQSKQCRLSGSQSPKKVLFVKSGGKVMASVFLNAKRILPIDCLSKNITINSVYYAIFYAKWKNKFL